MLVHPKNLPQKTLYAIDQFVMRGGRVLLFVDPYSGADTGGQDPSNPMAAAMANHASNLEPLLAAWGVDYDPGKVIGDLDLGLEVRTSMQGPPLRHIGILGLRRDELNQKDVVTGSLESINVATAGFLSARARRHDEVRAAAAKFQGRGTDPGTAIQRTERSVDSARWVQADRRSLRPGRACDRAGILGLSAGRSGRREAPRGPAARPSQRNRRCLRTSS